MTTAEDMARMDARIIREALDILRQEAQARDGRDAEDIGSWLSGWCDEAAVAARAARLRLAWRLA